MIVLSDDKKNSTKEEIQSEIEKVNKNLTKIEKIKKFFISDEKFSIENGMVTPTMKLKRYKIIQKYKNNFENLY
jgi:long-chain acyl-CoA synthetase